MSPAALMLGASLLFAVMGLCVKLASTQYGAGEIVMYRSLAGLVLMGAALRARGLGLATPVPGMHLWRSVSGAAGLVLWFYAIAGLPLATAMTLNAMSSVWIAFILMAAAGWAARRGHGARQPDRRLVAAVMLGFVGVALVLRPTLADDQLLHGLLGLASGVLAAVAYLQVSALGRVGEPGERVVFYFSATGTLFGLAMALAQGGLSAHTPRGVALLLAIGTLASLAQWMLTRAYGSGATLGVAALQYAGIAFSFILGLVVLDDRLTPLAVAGIALIAAAGVAATLWREPALPPPPAAEPERPR